MTRVTGTGGAGSVATRQNATPTGTASAGFSVSGNDPAPAHQVQPASGALLSSMLALQEVEAGTLQDKAARRHGLAMLEALSQLQKSLLSRHGDGTRELAALSILATEMPEPANPGLAAVLTTIRLRAKIELLRQGKEIS